MLDNPLLTTVGSLIGVSGLILSYIMCVAMNRSLTNVLFGGLAGPAQTDYKIEGSITKTSVDETVDALANADSVILVSPRPPCTDDFVLASPPPASLFWACRELLRTCD